MKLSISHRVIALSLFLVCCAAGSVQAQGGPGTQPFKNQPPPNSNPRQDRVSSTNSSTGSTGYELRRRNPGSPAFQAVELGDRARQATPADYNGARVLYDYALSLDIKEPRAFYGLGEVYRGLNRTGEAVKAYEQALTLNPKMVEAQVGLGWTYHSQKLFDKATQHFQAAMTLKPKSVEAHLGLAACQVAQKSYADAAAIYLKAIKFDSKSVAAFYNLGVTYLLMDNREAASAQQSKLTKLDKDVAAKLEKLIAEGSSSQK